MTGEYIVKIWDPKWECASRKDIYALQEELLKEQVKIAWKRLPYYLNKMKEKGITPSDINSLEDLRLLPFTVKKDFMDNYPYGMIAVPLREIVRIHGSSGTTTGKSTIVGYTKNDLNVWAETCARLVTGAGATSDDVAQICFGYGLFTGGFGLHAGLERVGATVLPLSSGNTERQIKFMQDFNTTTLISTPTYALHIGEVAADLGVKPGDLKLKWGLFGGEPFSCQIQHQLDKLLNITATDNYGLSELQGPGVSFECLERDGLHICEDHFLVELINPETLEPVEEEGAIGELVFTALTREANPIIRYRTRDLATITKKPCKCGRTTIKMSKVKGRSDDMLIIRGINIFPSQIESVLMQIEHAQPHYQIILTKKGVLDAIEIKLEVTEKIFFDEMKKLKSLEEEIHHKLKNAIGIDCKVSLVEPKSLERFTGKAKRVVDMRDK